MKKKPLLNRIEYKDSTKLGLIIIKEPHGYTVMRQAPKVIYRKTHGKNYPQFYNENLDAAYDLMIHFLTTLPPSKSKK